ncbi:MAG: aminopeptidase [Cyclobacteriaceae bacterium]|nr:aminopeptidase [Cyclobacteriaceae bacterium]
MITRRLSWFSSVATCLLIVLVIGCGEKKKPVPESGDLDFRAIADLMVARSNLQPGEQVLIVARPGRFDSLVALLEQAVAKTGANYLGAISTDSLNQPEAWTTDFVRAALHKSDTDLTAQLGEVDLGIMLPGAVPTDKPYAAMQEVLNMGHGRTIHFHWSGAYDVLGQPIEITPAIDRLYQQVLMDTRYDSLTRIQQRFDSAMRNADVRITTPAGTDLTFRIGDRQVTKQDGDASLGRIQYARNLIDREVELPAGAIRVAPIEETVEGTIAFPDGLWNGKKVEGLVLTFKKGKVVNISAKSGQESVKAELDKAGDAGYSFRELAVGFNPLLTIPTDNPFIPYYGYGAGIIRLSLGDNTELGGNVKGGYVRWNFFLDATVAVGDDLWVRDGVLLK